MTTKVKKEKINLLPTAGYVLLEPLDVETKTDSGIYLPDSVGEKPQKAKVLAVGEDEILESGMKKKCPCKVKDIIIYKKWGGNEVKIDGKDYIFSKFDDILAIEI